MNAVGKECRGEGVADAPLVALAVELESERPRPFDDAA
jgi:hypothetical protein